MKGAILFNKALLIAIHNDERSAGLRKNVFSFLYIYRF